MLALAEIHVDARGEAATEDLVHREQCDLTRVALGRRHVAGEDDRLLRARTVDEIHRRTRLLRYLADVLARDFTGTPAAEEPLQLRCDLGQCRRADDDEG